MEGARNKRLISTSFEWIKKNGIKSSPPPKKKNNMFPGVLGVDAQSEKK